LSEDEQIALARYVHDLTDRARSVASLLREREGGELAANAEWIATRLADLAGRINSETPRMRAHSEEESVSYRRA
jgi:hypothetical protein